MSRKRRVPLLAREPSEHDTLDRGEVAGLQLVARRSTKRRARDIAEQGERVAVSSDAGTIALANVVEHGKRQAAIVLLEVLELRTETRPATGRTAVHPQRTAHAVVGR